jgi:hypothetical protein
MQAGQEGRSLILQEGQSSGTEGRSRKGGAKGLPSGLVPKGKVPGSDHPQGFGRGKRRKRFWDVMEGLAACRRRGTMGPVAPPEAAMTN